MKYLIILLILFSCKPSKVKTEKNEETTTEKTEVVDKGIEKTEKIEEDKSSKTKKDIQFIIVPSKTDTIVREIRIRDEQGAETTAQLNPNDTFVYGSSSIDENRLQKTIERQELVNLKIVTLENEIKKLKEKTKVEKQTFWERIKTKILLVGMFLLIMYLTYRLWKK